MNLLKHVFILLILFSINSLYTLAQVTNSSNCKDTTTATLINTKGGPKHKPYALYEFYANGLRYVAKGKTSRDLMVGEQFVIVYNKFNPYENKIIHAVPVLDANVEQVQTKGVIFRGDNKSFLFAYTIIDQEGNTVVYEKRQFIDKVQKNLNPTDPYIEGVEYTVRYPAKDPERAIIYLDSKIEANNTTALVYYYRGIHAFNEHRLKAALILFNNAIVEDKSFSRAYYMRGLVHNQLNNESAASDDFSKAIDLNPNSWEAHYQKGLIYKQEKDYNSALQEFQKAESLNPNKNDLIYVSTGEVYYLMGMYNESEAAFTQAIAINPTDSVNYYNRALAKIQNSGNIQAGQTDLLDAEHNGYKRAGRVLRSNNTNHSLITNSQKIPEKAYWVYSIDYSRYPYHTAAGSFTANYVYGVSGYGNQQFTGSASFMPVNQVGFIDFLNLECGSYEGAYGGLRFGLNLINSHSASFDIGGGYNFNLKPIPQHIIRLGADFSYTDQTQYIGSINNYGVNLTINNTNFNYITYTHSKYGTTTHYHGLTYVSFINETYSIKPKMEFWLFPRDRFSARFMVGYNLSFAQNNGIHFYQGNSGSSTTVDIPGYNLNFKMTSSTPIQNIFSSNGVFFSIGGVIRLNDY